MPTETVYGLAADATSDTAVAAIYAAKERPAINPLIAHVLDIEAAREHGLFGPEAETLARAFWPGPLTLVLPVALGLKDQPARARRPRQRGDARAVARNGAGADRGGRRPARRAFRQSLGPGEPDDRRACRGRSRRPGRLHPRRRPMPPRPRIDDRRLSWRPGRNCCVRARSRARRSKRRSGRRSSAASAARSVPNAPGQLASHYAPKAALRLAAASVQADEAALDFGGALEGGRPRARGSIFRRPETSSRRRRISFPIFARSTPAGPPRIAVAPIPAHGLGAAINDRLRRAAAPRGR